MLQHQRWSLRGRELEVILGDSHELEHEVVLGEGILDCLNEEGALLEVDLILGLHLGGGGELHPEFLHFSLVSEG